MPQRIQRKRAKGWRMPEGAVYVGRPSVFGNRFVAGAVIEKPRGVIVTLDAEGAVRMYRRWLTAGNPTPTVDRIVVTQRLPELRGRDLVCWCPLDAPCHADVLLELANGGAS